MRKQRRLGRTGRAGGKDDQRAIVLGDLGQGGRAFSRIFICIHPIAIRRLGNRRIGLRAFNRFVRVYCDEMLNPFATRLYCAPQRTKIDMRFYSQRDKAARPEDFQRANHLGGGQTQVQRGDDYADFEAAIFQQNVIHGERQQGDQKISLDEAQAQ